MVDMSAISAHDRLAAQEPSNNGKAYVEDRNGQRHQGRGHSKDRRRFLTPGDPKASQQKPHQKAAGIPEKNRGRIEIVTQKTGECASKWSGCYGKNEIVLH